MIIEHIPLYRRQATGFNLYDVLRLAINGLQSNGVKTRVCYRQTNIAANSDALLSWGWRRSKRFARMKKPIILLEHGYIGDRTKNISVALNGLNGRGVFPHPVIPNRLPPSTLKPWRNGGTHILIAGQVKGDQALRGLDLYRNWYADKVAQCRHFGLPIVFRQHPVEFGRLGPRHIDGAITSTASLADDLSRAALVVTYSSNLGVDAMLAGVPTVVEDMGGMAYPIALNDIPDTLNVPEPPNRYEWANRIASYQFSLDEIERGVWVPAILEHFESIRQQRQLMQ